MSDQRPTDPQARLALLAAEHEVVDPTGRGDFWPLADAVAAELGVDDLDRTADGKAALDRLEGAGSSRRSSAASSAEGDQGAQGAQGAQGDQGAQGPQGASSGGKGK